MDNAPDKCCFWPDERKEKQTHRQTDRPQNGPRIKNDKQTLSQIMM